jgi:hypothetical protein
MVGGEKVAEDDGKDQRERERRGLEKEKARLKAEPYQNDDGATASMKP